MDSVFAEKQQRLLTESLYSSWAGPGDGRPFAAMAQVPIVYGVHHPAVVPDVLVGLDITLTAGGPLKGYRFYFTWEHGKTPDVVVEIVSHREGGEDTTKMALYERIAVRYYAIFDPEHLLGPETLRAYRFTAAGFEKLAEPYWFSDVGLGLQLWQGRFENMDEQWLRWVDAHDRLICTGCERADRLAEQLRRMGVEPEA